MKTKKDFLTNYATNPDLAKKVLNKGGLSWAEIKNMGWDAYDAGSGAVPGMIYYSDTVPFAKRNHLLILQALEQFEQECGRLEGKPTPTNETQYFNWLAWFAWENTMGEVLNYLDIN